MCLLTSLGGGSLGFEDGILYSPGLEQGLERTLAVETTWDVLSFHVCLCMCLCVPMLDYRQPDFRCWQMQLSVPFLPAFLPRGIEKSPCSFWTQMYIHVHECSCVLVGFISEAVCFLF